MIFLKAPLTSGQAMRVVKLRDGVDQAWPGSGVVYFARLSERRTQSLMSRIVGTPEYQRMTIRSWSTTTKLLGLLDEPTRPLNSPDARRGTSEGAGWAARYRLPAAALPVVHPEGDSSHGHCSK